MEQKAKTITIVGQNRNIAINTCKAGDIVPIKPIFPSIWDALLLPPNSSKG
ncbi:hypothetical protein M1N59_00895 [Dehalococcoidales bacterium]|nr:hypothetical protein [Dehalococcoidales bacterium]